MGIPIKKGTFWGSELVLDMYEDHYCTGPNVGFTIYPGDDFDGGWFAFEDVKYIESTRVAGDPGDTVFPDDDWNNVAVKLAFFPESGMWPYDQYFCDENPESNYGTDYLTSGCEGGQDLIHTIDPYIKAADDERVPNGFWGANMQFDSKEEWTEEHVFSQVSSINYGMYFATAPEDDDYGQPYVATLCPDCWEACQNGAYEEQNLCLWHRMYAPGNPDGWDSFPFTQTVIPVQDLCDGSQVWDLCPCTYDECTPDYPPYSEGGQIRYCESADVGCYDWNGDGGCNFDIQNSWTRLCHCDYGCTYPYGAVPGDDNDYEWPVF